MLHFSNTARRARLVLAAAIFVAAASLINGCGSSASPTVETVPPALSFSLPTAIIADTAPYASYQAALDDVANIDWRAEPAKVTAAQLAWAAAELKAHLALLGVDAIVTARRPATTPQAVQLLLPDAPVTPVDVDFGQLGDQGFAIGRQGDDVYVAASTSVGAVYGAYALLEYLGFAWPTPTDTVVPDIADVPTVWPAERERPVTALRGFWIYGDQPLSTDFTHWLARNRFNVAAGAPDGLRQLLAIREWGGGHYLLQEEFSAPGLFMQHPEWFSVINGVRRPVSATGNYFNPAFGNPEAAEYFAARMIDRLSDGDLQDVDILNIWPADSRGNSFDQSAAAQAIGNETDNLLSFYRVLTEELAAAYERGELDRRVTVGGISYYLTWLPPTNVDVVDTLAGQDFINVFYLNERSWAGPIDRLLDQRDTNRRLVTELADWRTTAEFTVGFVEYYNYSIYAALALTDYPYLLDNYANVAGGDTALYAYMHPLETIPGPRALTNRLLKVAGWSSLNAVAVADPVEVYFDERFGDQAASWRAVHELMARSVENAAELFGQNSLTWALFMDQIWTPQPYSDAEAVGFIQRYRNGGQQALPTFVPTGFVNADFPGLDASIALHEQARAEWEAILASSLDADVRARIEADVVWFESTASRYRLIAASADFVVDHFNGADVAASRAAIEAEIAFLEASPTTNDTISPVNQRAFLNFYRRLIE